LTQYEEADMNETGDSASPSCLERVEEVADLYAGNSVRVRRLVSLDVQAPDALIEDACQVAWVRLVVHRRRVRRETAVRWLVRVAVNDARRQLSRGGRELSLEKLLEDRGEPLPAPDLMADLAEHRDRLAAIGELPVRQQRLVWLHGLGFSYAEMAGTTGDSRRTVERQLDRARRALAHAGPAVTGASRASATDVAGAPAPRRPI
jgi:RNA polymerase sigma factor (sigma-70 family)